MKRLRQQSIEQPSKVKRWQWVLLSAILSVTLIALGLYRTRSFAGFWGFLDDEIAVVTIESDKDGQRNVTIKDPSKSFWDILELLGVIAVPLVLAALGAWFQRTQQEQADQIAKEQRKQDGDETREEVLQLYFDRISTLLIDKGLMALVGKGGIATEQEELLKVSTDVIQARTSSVLRRFEKDLERKISVIRFLAATDVISRLEIDFSGVNLSHADLFNLNLSRAVLLRAHLSHADLSFARLGLTNLNYAVMCHAVMCHADLSHASLNYAFMCHADLSRAILCEASLGAAILRGAILRDADLRGATLRDAILRGADLSNAELIDADLRGADLRDATVTSMSFSTGTDLSDEAKQDLIQRGAIFDTELEEQKPTT